MAEPAEVNDVLQVTGLTPSTPAAPEPAPSAAPSESEAQPAEHPAAAEAVEAESATAQTPDAPSEKVSRETEGEVVPAPQKPSRGVQKALDRLTREREEARTQNVQLSTALATVLQQLQANRQPAETAPQRPTQVVQAETQPDRKDYPDWEAFNRATAQWEARQASTQVVRQELGNFVRAIVGQQVQTNAQAESQALLAKLNDARAKAPERFADWDDKVVASDAPMSPSLMHAITLSDDPALVMHHLGVNPEEHAKLLAMSPAQQLYQVGRIVASGQPQTRVSNAPPPARPVGGAKGGQTGLQYSDNMTPDQHRQWVAKQGLSRGLK